MTRPRAPRAARATRAARAAIVAAVALAVATPVAHAQLPAPEAAAAEQAKRDEAARDAKRAADAPTGALPAPPVTEWTQLRWRDVPDAKSPGAAFAISAASTAGAVLLGALILGTDQNTDFSPSTAALALAPLVIAPSAGHFYTYDSRTLIWLAVRATGAVLLASDYQTGCPATADDCVEGPPGRWGDLGIVLLVGGVVADLVTAPGAAVRYNDSHRHKVVVTPFSVRDGWGLSAAGAW